ncbi:multidrug/biocide efflux PACE transporter [Glaciimonas immobilis]|nr:multidrug/biocide efflux PACE transporter [Glaciimonas immobilis]
MSGKITKTSTGETPNLNSAFNAAKTGKSSHGSSNRKSFAERGLHALIFELLAIAISAPVLSWLMGVSMAHAGLLTLMISLIAMVWNVAFNALFDSVERRLNLVRTFKVRVVHAVFFELGLIVTVVPLAAWWLNMTLLDAFVLDIGLLLFFLPYTLLYNMGYDKARALVLKRRQATS